MAVALPACQRRRHRQPPSTTNMTGRELAAIHCASCHLEPAPELLPKSIWQNGVLPEMAYRLGMKPVLDKLGALDPDEIRAILNSGAYPDGPLLSEEDWQKIVRYYVDKAPERPVPQDDKMSVADHLPYFDVRPIGEVLHRPPMISMLKIDTSSGRLFVGRRGKRQLEVYDRSMRLLDSIPLESPVSDVLPLDDGALLLLEIGMMEPNDGRSGRLLRLAPASHTPEVLLEGLQRPVQLTRTDLNQDGTPDYLICNYGNETGRLAWYDGRTRQVNTLKAMAGARTAEVRDLNGDGLPDIAVLMCQAWESITIWYNQGGGRFEEQIVLQFSPVYGSSYMTLADMNADGHPDILYTNGDNADYSFSPKAYHGLRIFLNDGKNHFTQSYFYPVYGASKVQAADFDGDGDLDLALIAFFPDDDQLPNEGFLFFENKGKLTFSVSTFPEGATGRWLVMDTGDLDADGRPDIVLSSFLKGGLGQGAATAKPASVILLRNIVTAPSH